MDKNQIYRMIVGLFLIPVGIYLYFLRVDYIIWSLVAFSGIALLISGARYKEQMKHRGLTGQARERYLASTYFVVTMTGDIILFSGLGGAVIASNMHATAMTGLFFVVFIVGVLVVFIGRAFRAKAFEANDKAEKHYS